MVGDAVACETQNEIVLGGNGRPIQVTLWLPEGKTLTVSVNSGEPKIQEVCDLHVVHEGDVIQCRLENSVVAELSFILVSSDPDPVSWKLTLTIPPGVEYVVDDNGSSAPILVQYHDRANAFAALARLAEMAGSRLTSKFSPLS